jgi:Uma2 family endonuclease
VWSPSNSADEIEMKKRLYLGKGAQEFWYCDAKGGISQFDQSGELTQSKLCPQFPKRVG